MNPEQVIEVLQPFVSDHKQSLIDRVLHHRTRRITLVFEDIDKPHNISAVLRTAECVGVQDVHFIENRNEYKVNPDIVQGAAKWLTLYQHNQLEKGANVNQAFTGLRKKGYRIYATTLDEGAQPVDELNPDEKLAIVFGTEATGVTDEVRKAADGLVHIPMKGFTESFNLSVSAAILLSSLMRNFSDSWRLSHEEKRMLRAEWYRKIVREADKILERAKADS